MSRTLNAVQNTGGNFVKAEGFQNVVVEHADGSKEKIGGIPLYANKEVHQWLMDNKENVHLMKFSFDVVVLEAKGERGLFHAAVPAPKPRRKAAIKA